MGFLSLLLLKACSVGSSKIKVMTVDGQSLKYEAPMIVKEVLMDYPRHTLFDSDTVRKLGNRARPLQSTLSLQPGHFYFLVPQASSSSRPHRVRRASASNGAILPASSDLAFEHSKQVQHCNSTQRRKVSCKDSTAAAAVPNSIKNSHMSESMQIVQSGGANSSEASMESLDAEASMESLSSAGLLKKSAVEFLPSPCDGVLRVKMVVSKRQLACVLKEGGDCVTMVEGLLSPLLREAEASRSDSRSLSWRPSLESIPEFSCHGKELQRVQCSVEGRRETK